MNICPNLSNKLIKAEFDLLVKIFGEDCAYLLWDRSNGMGLKLAPNGASSKLYLDLLELHNGDERAALIDKAKIYTQAFRLRFGKFGNTAQVKYYGPTMGKTTAAKTNKNLVDFDDVVRDDIKAAAEKAGLSVREYKKQGSEEYHNLLLDAIYKWRNDRNNVGKTLVVSNAVLAKDDIYDNTPMLPRKDAFVDRLVNRSKTHLLSQLTASFKDLLNNTKELAIDRERDTATLYYDDLVLKWMPDNVVFSDAYVSSLEDLSDRLDQNGEPLLFFLLTRHPDMFGSIGLPKPTTSAAVHSTNSSLRLLREKIEELLVDHLKKIGIKVHGRRDLKRYLDTLPTKIQLAVENVSKGTGVTVETEALNITGNKFKKSLYRGQGYAPIIDEDGNLHLHTNYDSLSKLTTLSFDSTIEGAEQYGNRAARHPYIIEVDEEFLDTVVPKGEYEREKVNNGESFRYDEEFNEVRLSFKDELIIPKGKFNITQSNETLHFETFDDVMTNIALLQSLEERSEIEEYIGASEIMGRVHGNDLRSLSNALHNTLGTYEGYDVATILYDILALQNDTPGSPIAPSKQYKEFINKGLIEKEYHDGYTYYRPSEALINHLTKKLGLNERQHKPLPFFYSNPHTPFAPHSSYIDEELPFFKTSNGEIYGFVTPEGEIYLDENVISPEHPIHEYTHLWDRAVAKKNPKLWKKGVELMKQTDLWAEILLDKNYGLKWVIDPNLSDELRDFLIASEVHARLVGKNGELEFEKIAKKQGSSNIVEKLKKWALDVWKTIADTFSPWTKSQILNLTLDDFVTITLRDFVLGTNISGTRMTSLELKQRLKLLGEEREKQCRI